MIKIFGGTDKGCVRETNQDAFVFEVIGDDMAYVVVCDGMGGESGGNIASEKAIEVIGQALERGLNPQVQASSVKSILTSAVTAANAVIYEMARQDDSLKGMGTTVVAGVIWKEILYVAHAGDSRVYLLRSGAEKPERLTKDHSVVQLLLDKGEIKESDARLHPKRNYITRALGVDKTIEVEYQEHPYTQGWLLFCSDGLYNYAPPEGYVDLITTCASEQDIYLLIDEANKAGGPDNITAVIVCK